MTDSQPEDPLSKLIKDTDETIKKLRPEETKNTPGKEDVSGRSAKTSKADKPIISEETLVSMFTLCAKNARDKTFKDSDIPEMATNMAKHLNRYFNKLAEEIIGEDETPPPSQCGWAMNDKCSCGHYYRNKLKAAQRKRLKQFGGSNE